MSPAGHWPQLHAAVEAGADSVYFGLTHFTARAKVGFTLAELPEVMRTLHRRGVRGFVTFNTLVFDHEINVAAEALAAIGEAGADAIIVQDPAALALAREVVPGLEIHASTQMSVTSAEGAQLAAEWGASRVTLARELSLDEIAAIRRTVDADLEVFVHGALCVAYSGQCFSSEAWGGRSANRGQCAQACRLPYQMFVDGRLRPLGDARYLLSPGDLFALHQVPDLVRIGVAALKIEGRYKDANYVAAVTRAYRKAVDEAAAGLPLSVTPDEELLLQQVYSRGMGPFFLTGTNHQAVVSGRAPRHRGLLMGCVARIEREVILIQPTALHARAPLKPGDGVVFDAADRRSPEEPEEGGRVFSVTPRPHGLLELRFGRDAVRTARLGTGDLVWRTHDPALDKQLRTLTQAPAPLHKQPLAVRVTACEGQPLETTWRLLHRPAVCVTVRSGEPLQRAQRQALDAAALRQQFGRLGGTPYVLAEIDLEVRGQPFAAASSLNTLRRQAVERLQEIQAEAPARLVHPPGSAVAAVLSDLRPAPPEADRSPAFHLLVRTPEQLSAALDLRPESITLDYLDLYGLKPSVESVKAAGLAVRVASPRILKPGEESMVDFLLRLECPILVRPAGLLHALRRRPGLELTGDFSLNAANAITAHQLLSLGLQRLTPAHDLNAAQVAELARRTGAHRIEAILYQHLPVFHTEHCVFCRFLSGGSSYKDCGRPCEKHRVELRDAGGRSHPLMADVGCRNTVFGAEAQEASLHLESWLAAGIRHFRLEFVHESAGQVRRITAAYRAALAGQISFRQLQDRVRKLAPQGSTQGSLFIPADHLSLPILQ